VAIIILVINSCYLLFCTPYSFIQHVMSVNLYSYVLLTHSLTILSPYVRKFLIFDSNEECRFIHCLNLL